MVSVTCRDRKGPVLTPSSIPCLQGLPTINFTEGCAHGCTYCYIQGYSNYPGPDRVVLYTNTPRLVREELARKRHKPKRVYFSPSSDAFQYLPEVQEVAYQTMAVLLEAGVEVAFLTKGFITEQFVKLFARTPQRVFAQLGITTLDYTLWQALEPRASPPEQRLASMGALTAAGIYTSARLDPLVPDLTDTSAQLRPLLDQLRQAGVTRAAVSYLFLRPPFAKLLLTQLQAIQSTLSTAAQWRYAAFREGAGGRMLDEQDRARRYASISAMAADAGIQIDICACKNPWHGGPGCQIAGPAAARPAAQPALFPICDT